VLATIAVVAATARDNADRGSAAGGAPGFV